MFLNNWPQKWVNFLGSYRKDQKGELSCQMVRSPIGTLEHGLSCKQYVGFPLDDRRASPCHLWIRSSCQVQISLYLVGYAKRFKTMHRPSVPLQTLRCGHLDTSGIRRASFNMDISFFSTRNSALHSAGSSRSESFPIIIRKQRVFGSELFSWHQEFVFICLLHCMRPKSVPSVLKTSHFHVV